MNHFAIAPLTSPAQDTYRASRQASLPSSATSLIAAAERTTSGPAACFRANRHRRSQVLGFGLLLLAGTAAHAKKVYYVSSSTGSDTNNGTSASTPWKTIAKANTILPTLGPSDAVLLNRGDVFRDDYLRCTNTKTITAGMTVSSSRPTCSGTAAAPITIGSYGSSSAPNPVVDAADPMPLSWTLVSGSTWKATVSGNMPQKLYVDGATTETSQLLPVANSTGNYVSNATYHPYDLVSSAGQLYVRGPQAPSAGVAPTNSNYWIALYNSFANNTSQNFSATNTGPENVEGTPGSWYGTGDTVYVHLADGSDPNKHSFEGSQRAYGVLLYGVNYVTVKNITVEHTVESAIASIAGPSAGTYFTGEHNSIINNKVFNYGTIVLDTLNIGGHLNGEVAGILVRASGDYNPHLVQKNLIAGNYVGHMDGYFGVRSAVHSAGITAVGVDANGTENDIVVQNNYIATVNTRGIVYNTEGLLTNGGLTLRNNGGRVTGNELVNNQGNIFFSTVDGGIADHNKIHDSFGEGIQSGGNSLSSSSAPQTFSYNLIYNLGLSASMELFNGFDCNGNLVNGYWTNNTVYNTYGADLTFENGCTYPHVHNNIFDQNAMEWPANDKLNASYLMYYVRGAGNLGPDFSNNVWVPGPQWHPFFGNHAPFTCATFFSGWPDKNSVCVTNPGFTNPAAGNFSLTSSSPALKVAENGTKAGAIQ